MTSTAPVVLADGRRLDVRVSGPDGGPVLVFHHGTPGAAVAIRPLERAAHARGLRVVTASRAGYGGSTRHPGRRVVDVVGDTGQVLDALDVSSCHVMGWSGGGPHALACAALLGGVTAAAVVAAPAPPGTDGLDWMAGMGEDNVVEFAAASGGEEVLRPHLDEWRPGLLETRPEGLLLAMDSLLPEADRAVMSDQLAEDMVAGFAEGLRTGVDGWVDDDLAFLQPWGFDLDAVTVPTSLWQGADDLMIPFAHGGALAAALPHASAHLEAGHGHLSILLSDVDRVLDELLAGAA